MSGLVGNSQRHVLSCRGSFQCNISNFVQLGNTVNFLNIWTPQKFVVITLKTMWLYHRVMSPNDADGMANSVDPLGAV